MRSNNERRARHGGEVQIPDYLVPALYISGHVDMRLSNTCRPGRDGPREVLSSAAPPLVAREAAIQRVERAILTGEPMVVVEGEIGCGKSQLLRHLAWWWKISGWYEEVILLDVSKQGAKMDTHDESGSCSRMMQETICSIYNHGAHASHQHESETLLDGLSIALTDLRIRHGLLIVDGLEEFCPAADLTHYYLPEWINFFNVLKSLSRDSCPVIFAMTNLSTVLEDATPITSVQLLPLGTSGATQLLEARGILKGNKKLGAGTLFNSVLDTLDYNPMAVLSHVPHHTDEFAGLNRLLGMGSLRLDQGCLGRSDVLCAFAVHWLSADEDALSIAILLTLSMFWHIVPDFQALRPLMEQAFAGMQDHKIDHWPLIRQSRDQAPSARLPLALVARGTFIPLPSDHHFTSPINTLESRDITPERALKSLWRVFDVLSALDLLNLNFTDLQNDHKGHRISPLATLRLRDWATRFLPPAFRADISHSFSRYYDERAVHLLAYGEHSMAYEMPTAKFIYAEKWNLISVLANAVRLGEQSHGTVITAVTRRLSRLLQDPEDSLSFPFKVFFAVAPLATTDDTLCSDYLRAITMEYLRRNEAAWSKPKTFQVIGFQGVLHIINWTIDYSLRHGNKDDELWLRSLAASVMRLGQLEDPAKSAISQSEQIALVSQYSHAMRTGNISEAGEVISRMKELKLAGRVPQPEIFDDLIEYYQVTAPFFDKERMADPAYARKHLANLEKLMQSNRLTPSLQRTLETGYNAMKPIVEFESWDGSPASATGNNVLTSFLNGSAEVPCALTFAYVMDHLQKTGFVRAISTAYFPHFIKIQRLLLRGAYHEALVAAQAALAATERNGEAAMAQRWRDLCVILGALDHPFDYGAMRRDLVKRFSKKNPKLSDRIMLAAAGGSMADAYALAQEFVQFWELVDELSADERDEIFPELAVQEDVKDCDNFKFCQATVEALEPYKEQNHMEASEEWRRAVSSILSSAVRRAQEGATPG